MGLPGFLTIVIAWSYVNAVHVAPEADKCASTIVPLVTINKNKVALHNNEPLSIALRDEPDSASPTGNVLVVIETIGLIMEKMNFVIPRHENSGEDVIIESCRETDKCSSGLLDLREYFTKDSDTVKLILSLESAKDSCWLNRTVIFSPETNYMRGPALITTHFDHSADINWLLPEFVDHVDITCCGNGSACTRATMYPAVNPTHMEMPLHGGDLYQFDFYMHDKAGDVRALIGDPRFLVLTPAIPSSITPTDRKNIGWIVFLTLTTCVSFIVIMILVRRLVDKNDPAKFKRNQNYTLVPTAQLEQCTALPNGYQPQSFYKSYADLELQEAENTPRSPPVAKLRVRKMASLLKIQQDLLSSSHSSVDNILVVDSIPAYLRHSLRCYSDGQLGLRSGNVNMNLIEEAQRDVSEVLVLRESTKPGRYISPA